MASVTEAAATGDRLKTLEALRARLAEDIDNPLTPARDRAALTRQLTAILDTLAEEGKPAEGSPLDEVNRRREERARRRSSA